VTQNTSKMFGKVPVGISLIKGLCPGLLSSRVLHKYFILLMTFLIYVFFHLSRKPISIVKNSEAFFQCAKLNETHICSSWMIEIDKESEEKGKTYMGLLDTSYLFSYAIFMFVSGYVAERMDLRVFLSAGMILSGIFTFLFGLAYPANIHTVWYLLSMQVILGVVQSSGWPGVVTVLANWFGKGRRGLIMGLWNSHTSIGNLLGSLIAGAFVENNWGMAFMVPGILIASFGVVVFLFMVPEPSILGFKDEDIEMEGVNKDKMEEENKKEEKNEHKEEKAIGFLGALRIPGVVEFSLCLFFAKLVAYTFIYWLPNYIHVMDHVNAADAAVLSTVFDVGAILGGVIAGVLSDKSGKPAFTCFFMLIIAIPIMLIYQEVVKTWCPMETNDGLPVKNGCFWWNVALTFLTGTLVNGPYALITTAVSAGLGQHPSLQGSSKALATVTAIIDGTGSIGAAVGPLLAGTLSGTGNWDNVFIMLVVSDVMALVLLSRLVIREVGTIIRKCGRG